MSDERKYAKTLGSTVRALRGTRTQREVAGAAGIPVSTLSKIEQARQIPRNETFAKIAHGLGVSAVELEQQVVANTLGALNQTSPRISLTASTPRFSSLGAEEIPPDMTGLPRSAVLRLEGTMGTIKSLRNHVNSLELDVVNLARELQKLRPSAESEPSPSE